MKVKRKGKFQGVKTFKDFKTKSHNFVRERLVLGFSPGRMSNRKRMATSFLYPQGAIASLGCCILFQKAYQQILLF